MLFCADHRQCLVGITSERLERGGAWRARQCREPAPNRETPRRWRHRPDPAQHPAQSGAPCQAAADAARACRRRLCNGSGSLLPTSSRLHRHGPVPCGPRVILYRKAENHAACTHIAHHHLHHRRWAIRHRTGQYSSATRLRLYYCRDEESGGDVSEEPGRRY